MRFEKPARIPTVIAQIYERNRLSKGRGEHPYKRKNQRKRSGEVG